MGAAAAKTTTFWQRVLTWRVALGVILLLAVLVRMPFLHVPLITDEGGYAYTTHYGLSGKTLYHLLWFDRTQGILWVYRVIFQTLGQSVVAIRLFAALYNAGSALLVYVIGRRLADKRTGLIAAVPLRALLRHAACAGVHRERRTLHDPPCPRQPRAPSAHRADTR